MGKKSVVRILTILLALLPVSGWANPASEVQGVTLSDSVRFHIHTPSRCSFGDMEAIHLELSNSRRQTLLLTVEPISPDDDSVPPIVRDLSYVTSLYDKGFSFSLPLSRLEAGRIYGIFICKDSGGDGRCNGKRFEDISEVLTNYSIDGDGVKTDPIDKVYFFKYIYVAKDRVLFPEKPASLTRLSAQRDYFSRYSRTTQQSVRTDFGRVMLIEERLGSMPLEKIDSSTVGIALPKIDPQRCYAGN